MSPIFFFLACVVNSTDKIVGDEKQLVVDNIISLLPLSIRQWVIREGMLWSSLLAVLKAPLLKQMHNKSVYSSWNSLQKIKEIYYLSVHCHSTVFFIILISDLNVTKFLRGQIESMKAFVRVAWIGPNLDHEFIRQNSHIQGTDARSVLIFHWWPSILLEQFDFISVAFPPCIDSTVVSYYFNFQRTWTSSSLPFKSTNLYPSIYYL